MTGFWRCTGSGAKASRRAGLNGRWKRGATGATSIQNSRSAAYRNQPNSRTGFAVLVRVALAMNFLRFLLSFIPSFEGTEHDAGSVEKLFGSFRIAGFRADFVWLLFSTPIIFLAAFYFLWEARKNRLALIDFALCLLWVAAFAEYVLRMLHTGLLDFG